MDKWYKMDERALNHQETLLYYDGPQLIVARDQVGQDYVCLLREVSEKNDSFFCVPISKRKLELLLSGEIDLRGIFENPEVATIYEAVVYDGDLLHIPTHEIDKTQLSIDWLPGHDLYLEQQDKSTDRIVRESKDRQRAVISCTLNPPEAQHESKISVENLIEGIGLYQRVLKYAYQKALQSIKQMNDVLKEILVAPQNYQLEVTGVSDGSFTIHMQTAANADMFGYSNIARALEIVDAVTNNIDDTEESFNIISKYSGHFATAYKDLLKFIIDKGVPFSYEWSMPQLQKGISRKIIPRQAKPLYEELTKRTEVGIEQKKFVGKFTRLDKSGAWKLLSDDDQREYSGTSNLPLAGTIFQTQRYSLICEETLSVNPITQKEISKLHLISFTQIE